MESKDNLLSVLQTLWNWRRPIVTVCLIAGLGSAAVSLLLPNYYRATTTFLASSPDQAKPEVVFFRSGARSEYYGNANDIDRLLTIAESNDLVEFLIDSLNLYDHYRINPEHERAPFRVKEKFFGLYKVKKTRRDAIELAIEDKDRQLAAKMANTAREKIDDLAQELIKKGQSQVIETLQKEIQEKEANLQFLGDTLNMMRANFGLYNTVAQTESLTAQQAESESRLVRNRVRLEVLQKTPGVPRDTITMLNALVKGLEQEVANFNQKIQLLNKGIAPINTLEKQYFETNQLLSGDLDRLKMWRAVYESSIPATILIEAAEVPIVKSRPRRSILVVAAVAIAFIFSVFAVLLIEAYQVNWREVLRRTDAPV